MTLRLLQVAEAVEWRTQTNAIANRILNICDLLGLIYFFPLMRGIGVKYTVSRKRGRPKGCDKRREAAEAEQN